MARHTETWCAPNTVFSPPCTSRVAGASKDLPTGVPLPLCIFCGGLEQDTAHTCNTCESHQEVVKSLCARVEDFTADMPLIEMIMDYLLWKEHGSRWAVSRMSGVIPSNLLRLCAVIRAASPPGRKARLFLEDRILLGQCGYAYINR